jgi:MerR family transcriptional regulator, copper efflux regulator
MAAVKTNLKDYLLINKAAAFIGVSVGTLRNWGRLGKIPTHRHPINKYRLYKKADLKKLLAAVRASALPSRDFGKTGGR